MRGELKINALILLLTLVLSGCQTVESFGNSVTLGMYGARLLGPADAGAQTALGAARAEHGALDEYLHEHGSPDYVYIKRDQIQLYYLASDQVALLDRSHREAGRLEIHADAAVRLDTLREELERARVARLREEEERRQALERQQRDAEEQIRRNNELIADIRRQQAAQVATAGAPHPSSQPPVPRPGPIADRAMTGGVFVEGYVPPRSPAYRPLYEYLANRRPFAPMVGSLNTWIRVPDRVEVVVEECGVPNAFYIPDYQRIAICYEFLIQLYQDLQGNEQMVDGTFWFVAYHELGHALTHVLNLPITGREEDAADQLAALMLLEMGGTRGDSRYVGGRLVPKELAGFAR